MKRCSIWFLLIICTLSSTQSATPTDQERATSLYQRGLAGDAGAVTECIALLEQILKSDPANQLARVYLGSTWTLRSRDLSFGMEKLRALKQGLALMDEAANAAPDNARIQLVRAVTNQSMPSFLGRRAIARDELYRLVELVERNPQKLSESDQQLLYLNAGFAAKRSGDREKAALWWKRGLDIAADPKLTAELEAALVETR